MFGNNFGYNSMPTATQPYGYPMNPYMNNMANPNQMQPQSQIQPQQPITTNTNKIYVNGIEDVRNRSLLPNSDYIFLDNDNAIIYQKIVDSKGQFEVKAFDIVPHIEQKETKSENNIDLSNYVKVTDLEPLQNDIKILKEKLLSKPAEIKKVDVLNGTTNTTK